MYDGMPAEKAGTPHTNSVVYNMTKTVSILIVFLFFSCSEKNKNSETENNSIDELSVSVVQKNPSKVIEISQQEKNFIFRLNRSI